MAWSKSTKITVMLSIDIAFFLLELSVGLIVGSLALMADAFHMLNDIISLLVGLWAVKAAQRSSSDQYSFGWLRAEILGAFFNAVFLIALCLSIVLEAVTRLIDPPQISNPMLILIVGSLGLTSNLVGFFVLGGHAHSHEGDEHDHDHSHGHGDKVSAAEEGYYHGEANGHGHGQAQAHVEADENGSVGDMLPEAAIARASQSSPDLPRYIRVGRADGNTGDTSKEGDNSVGRSLTRSFRRHRRRTSSIRANRISNIDDLSIHPASFRQEIIAISRPQLDGIQSEEVSEADNEAIDDIELPHESSPLIRKRGNGLLRKQSTNRDSQDSPSTQRQSSTHVDHNHNKPRKAGQSTGHNHGDMGMRAMVLHVIGDALGNVGVIISALIIWFTPWSGRFYADPAVSLFITLIILKSAIPLTTATAKILLQATPEHIIVKDVKDDIEDILGIVSCHDVHIWQLSDSQIVASMHIQVDFPLSNEGGDARYMQVARQARECLHAYGIHSATIQPEFCLDQAHGHGEASHLGFDGASRKPNEDRSCLLSCVDECEGRGCCSSPGPSSAEPMHVHSEHDGHDH